MDETESIEVVFAPSGFVFELVWRCRGVPFVEGVFHQVAFIGGEVWAVDFQSSKSDVPARWRLLRRAGAHEIGLRRDVWPRR